MPVNKNWKQVMISELSKNNQSERPNKLLLTLTFCAPKMVSQIITFVKLILKVIRQLPCCAGCAADGKMYACLSSH